MSNAPTTPYQKIFGVALEKYAQRDQSPAEFTKLRHLVSRYELQLEQASTTVLLQDKVLSKLERQMKRLSKSSLPAGEIREICALDQELSAVLMATKRHAVADSDHHDDSEIHEEADDHHQHSMAAAERLEILVAEEIEKASRLSDELATTKSRVTHLESELQDSRLENASLVADAEKNSTDKTQLEQQLSERIAAHTELQAIAEEHNTVKAELERQLKESSESHAAELVSANNTVQELKVKVEAHEALQADLEAAEARAAELVKQVEIHQQEAAVLTTTHTETIDAHEKAKAELVHTREQIADLNGSLDALQAEHDATKQHLEEASASLAAATSAASEHATTLSSRDADMNESRAEAAKLLEDLSSAKSATEDTRKSLEAANVQLHELEQKKQAAEKTLQSTQSAFDEYKRSTAAHLTMVGTSLIRGKEQIAQLKREIYAQRATIEVSKSDLHDIKTDTPMVVLHHKRQDSAIADCEVDAKSEQSNGLPATEEEPTTALTNGHDQVESPTTYNEENGINKGTASPTSSQKSVRFADDNELIPANLSRPAEKDVPAPEEPKAEEPQVEEPKVEEPTVEEPKAEEAQVEEPKAEEPQVEKPKAEELQVEEPKVEESQVEEPQVEEPKVDVPQVEELKEEEAKRDEPEATASDEKVTPPAEEATAAEEKSKPKKSKKSKGKKGKAVPAAEKGLPAAAVQTVEVAAED